MEATVQTHRFIQIEDQTRPGHATVTELTAADVAAIYGSLDLARLALGQTIRLGDMLHTDLQASHRARVQAEALRPSLLDRMRASLGAAARPIHGRAF